VRGADNPPDDPVSPGERYGFVYEINFLRCIHCDLCVEACPTEAITESKMFEFSFTNREDAIYTKSELVVDDEGHPQVLPWEDWNPGDDLHTSAWARATAPGGSAAMEGRPLWSAELGYGVRPAQLGQSDPQAADITADTDQSLREMLAPALRGIGVRTVRPVRSAPSAPEVAMPVAPPGRLPPTIAVPPEPGPGGAG
jgi:NADH-quinone oxidoreductase subunit I